MSTDLYYNKDLITAIQKKIMTSLLYTIENHIKDVALYTINFIEFFSTSKFATSTI